MEWHPYAMSFPLLSGYGRERVKASLKKHGQLHPITYRMKDGKKQGLDGRNREILLLELGKEPEYKKVFKDDHEVKEFIDSENWDRRHETPERQKEDRESRIERVKEAAAEGKSTREIAKEEGVSHTTVENDLATPSGNHLPPKKPRSNTKKSGKKKIDSTPISNGKPDPFPVSEEPEKEETLEDAIAAKNHAIESFCRKLMKLVDEECPEDPWLKDMGRRDAAIQKFKDGCTTLRNAKCVGSCPMCKGQACAKCHKTGRVTRYAMDQLVG